MGSGASWEVISFGILNPLQPRFTRVVDWHGKSPQIHFFPAEQMWTIGVISSSIANTNWIFPNHVVFKCGAFKATFMLAESLSSMLGSTEIQPWPNRTIVSFSSSKSWILLFRLHQLPSIPALVISSHSLAVRLHASCTAQ